MPTSFGCNIQVECLQVTFLVQYIVGLVGLLVSDLATVVANLGAAISNSAANTDQMVLLTNGIFGQNSGLIYWINNKIFYLIENMPWCDLGAGLGQLLDGLQNPPAC